MHCKDKVVRGDVQSNPLDKDDHILPPNGKSIIENTCWYLHQWQRYVLWLFSGFDDRIKEKNLVFLERRRQFNDGWVTVLYWFDVLIEDYQNYCRWSNQGKLQSFLRLRNFQNPLNKEKSVGLECTKKA